MTRPHADTPRFVYIAAGIAALGGFLFGYDQVVIAGAILFIKKQFALSSTNEEVLEEIKVARTEMEGKKGR